MHAIEQQNANLHNAMDKKIIEVEATTGTTTNISQTIKESLRRESPEGEISNDRIKEAAGMVPEPWAGEASKISFVEFAGSVKNWASALHKDAPKALEKAEQKVEDFDDSDLHGITDLKNNIDLDERIHRMLCKATTLAARLVVDTAGFGKGLKAWHMHSATTLAPASFEEFELALHGWLLCYRTSERVSVETAAKFMAKLRKYNQRFVDPYRLWLITAIAGRIWNTAACEAAVRVLKLVAKSNVQY